jgi:hypothetical protein
VPSTRDTVCTRSPLGCPTKVQENYPPRGSSSESTPARQRSWIRRQTSGISDNVRTRGEHVHRVKLSWLQRMLPTQPTTKGFQPSTRFQRVEGMFVPQFCEIFGQPLAQGARYAGT